MEEWNRKEVRNERQRGQREGGQQGRGGMVQTVQEGSMNRWNGVQRGERDEGGKMATVR